MSLFIILYYKFEFLGYAYLLVYVGAIAVLFLFLLISVNIKVESRKIILNKDYGKFIVVFNFISIPLYLFFSSLYVKVKEINHVKYFLKAWDVRDYIAKDIANKVENEVGELCWDTGILEKKLVLLNQLLSQSYRGGINYLDNNSFFRYLNNKITILGDYFLNYNGFFLIVISLLLFISIIVSVTICLSNEKNEND